MARLDCYRTLGMDCSTWIVVLLQATTCSTWRNVHYNKDCCSTLGMDCSTWIVGLLQATTLHGGMCATTRIIVAHLAWIVLLGFLQAKTCSTLYYEECVLHHVCYKRGLSQHTWHGGGRKFPATDSQQWVPFNRTTVHTLSWASPTFITAVQNNRKITTNVQTQIVEFSRSHSIVFRQKSRKTENYVSLLSYNFVHIMEPTALTFNHRLE